MIPPDTKLPIAFDEIQSQAEEGLGELHRRGKWQPLCELAKRYLEAWPQRKKAVGPWLEASQRTLEDASQIKLEENAEATSHPYSDKHKWDSLYAEAKKHRKGKDWAALKLVSREMLRLRLDDQGANQFLQEALEKEAKGFRDARRYEEAEANVREMVQLDPTRNDAWQLLNEVRLNYARDAKRRYDWETALGVAQRILEAPALNDRNTRQAREAASKLKDEAEEALRLLKRIKLLP